MNYFQNLFLTVAAITVRELKDPYREPAIIKKINENNLDNREFVIGYYHLKNDKFIFSVRIFEPYWHLEKELFYETLDDYWDLMDGNIDIYNVKYLGNNLDFNFLKEYKYGKQLLISDYCQIAFMASTTEESKKRAKNFYYNNLRINK